MSTSSHEHPDVITGARLRPASSRPPPSSASRTGSRISEHPRMSTSLVRGRQSAVPASGRKPEVMATSGKVPARSTSASRVHGRSSSSSTARPDGAARPKTAVVSDRAASRRVEQSPPTKVDVTVVDLSDNGDDQSQPMPTDGRVSTVNVITDGSSGLQPKTLSSHGDKNVEEEQCEEDENNTSKKTTEFRVPSKSSGDEFDSRAFVSELRDLCTSLEQVLRNPVVDVFVDERLTTMVSAVAGTMENFKAFAFCVQELMTMIRDYMKSATDFIIRKVLQPMTAEKGYRPVADANQRSVSLAEVEMTSLQQQLNSQLAKANENLQRAMVMALQAEQAANQANIAAEQAAEQARLAQAEYDERRRVEEEMKMAAERTRRLAEQRAAEAERQKQEEMRALEQRKASLRKPRDDSNKMAADVENWKLVTIVADHRSEFDGGVACLLHLDTLVFDPSSFKCTVAESSEISSPSVFDSGEELIGNYVHLSSSSPTADENADDDVRTLPKPVLVSLPYGYLIKTSTRTALIKQYDRSQQSWRALKTTDVTCDTHKGLRFVQAEVTSLPALLVVVGGLRTDYLHLPRRGGITVASDLDKNVTFTGPPLEKREFFTLQLQMIDSDVKARLSGLKGLLASSPIINLSWLSTTFSNTVTVTIPVPPNPVKVARLAASRAAKSNKPKVGVTEPTKSSRSAASTARSTVHEEEENKDAEDSRKPRRWYLGQYGSPDDDEKDSLSLVVKGPNGKWTVDEDVVFTEPKIDIVQFDLQSPITRFVILRTRTSVPAKTLNWFAEDIEQLVDNKAVCSVIRQREENRCEALHLLVPCSRLDRCLRRLDADGFTSGPDPSAEFFVTEGEAIDLAFHNNICVSGDGSTSTIPLVFHSNVDVVTRFTLTAVDRFLQKHADVYRGKLIVSRRFLEQPTVKEAEDTPVMRAVSKVQLVATHQISIPKDLEPGMFDIVESTAAQTTYVVDAMLNDPQVQVLQYVAGELGDEWLVLSQYLKVTSTRLHNIRRQVERSGLDETQMKLDMLLCWFRAQPRSVDKIDKLRRTLGWTGRDDLAKQLVAWRKGTLDITSSDSLLTGHTNKVITFA